MDPDLTFDPNQLPVPEDLICAAEDILDRGALRDAINTAIADCGTGGGERRRAVVPILKDAIKSGRDRIAAAFLASPFESIPTTQAYAWLTDAIVIEVFELARTHLHPLNNPTEAERLALIAVGGSGRGEMAPQSDVDLLFLAPYKLTPWSESLIESMLYILWDLKLKVGHASRTVKDCLRLAGEDYTIRTSLVEERFLVGDAALAVELTERLRTELFASTIPEFIEAKLVEREERHQKQGGQRYMVEPNVKEGKGGLRDLQSLYWIGKYIHGVKDASELVKFKVFTQDEYEEFKAAHEFLWAVRCHLHLLTGRATDQLTFDMQVEVADRMHYKDRGGRRAVEHFMQDYFRFATDVGELTRIFLVAQEEALLKAKPMLQRLFIRKKKAKAPYAIKHNRLTVENPDAFLTDKLNLLRIFEEALRTGTLIHSDAMRLIKANLYLIDDEVRANKEARRIFLDLMLKHGNPERALRRMNELGVLGAFIPEFEAIVAMMQFNMYHHYTVDEHTIQTISHLAKIERAELDEELPVSASIIKGGINRKVLYVALLLHDIGKGRDEDHSILGAKIVRKVAPRLGLSKKDCETVEWLVRYHLLMSDMAQKRDIADPRTVRDFAKAVKTTERLDLLCVLTVCDIRGVGPDTWNNWKAVLIRGLYRQTRFALENGMEALNREERGTEARKNLRAALPDWSEKALRAEVARHYPPYWQGLHVTAHVDFANLLAGIGTDEVRINLTPDDDRDATRVCFAMADHPGIFSRMCGALSLAGANVVDARTFTSKDGFATAAFWVQDSDGHPYEEARLPRLRQVIERTLQGEIVPREALADKGKFKKREKAFRVPTSITFDNEGSEIYTIIEVDTRDRLGLLHDLTRTLANANVYISSAVIATYGEQVVDTFYVKDMFGLKFHAESKRNALERKLRDAIMQGVERDSG
ncbi:[protein-PII] uridylyltransferase [Octadecabacter ascidiaceicola]|uniref:Bifunctional uridylyltransferase/uridylyl-removing enzyme n=1 Tax=Octadecabacter ascidiaceicola TaxID=1655543 RepID=A0A238K9E1_9RHOB|nr:[protein-PII] uridylyltransferase [Octadecabacter ascidiaceicola]SMX39087.1 Bifunctional uridylyltransferase/uridylyl-removing enzyme [Octadecabacter ascidiaceicola]